MFVVKDMILFTTKINMLEDTRENDIIVNMVRDDISQLQIITGGW